MNLWPPQLQIDIVWRNRSLFHIHTHKEYLAWLVASALSCLTATSTEWPSRSGRGEPSPRNSGSPSASHRWTCQGRRWNRDEIRFFQDNFAAHETSHNLTSPNWPSPSFSLKISCCRGNSAAEMSFLVRESTVRAGTAYILLPVTPCSRTMSVSA